MSQISLLNNLISNLRHLPLLTVGLSETKRRAATRLLLIVNSLLVTDVCALPVRVENSFQPVRSADFSFHQGQPLRQL